MVSVAALLTLVVVLACLFVWRRSRSSPSLAHIPGDAGAWPILGDTFDEFDLDSDFYLKKVVKYGPVCKYSSVLGESVIVGSPELVKQVLQTDQHLFSKRVFFYEWMQQFIGEGLVTIVDQDVHRALRGTIAEAFSYSNLKLYFPIFNYMGIRLVNKWQRACDAGVSVNVGEDFGTCTLDIIGRTAFGVDFNGFELASKSNSRTSILFSGVHQLMNSMTVSLFEFVPGIRHYVPGSKIRTRASNTISDQMVTILNDKKQANNGHGNNNNGDDGSSSTQRDLLDVLSKLCDESGSPLSLSSIIDQAKTFLIAGHETTAVSLAWSFYYLATMPEVQERLWDEIKALLPHHPSAAQTGFPVVAVDGMKYLGKVVKEVLRIRGPVSAVIRHCEEDTNLAGYHLPKGVDVVVSMEAMHRHPDLWEHPDTFDPDRWDNIDAQKVGSGMYVPFAMGSRNCIGNRFALLEIKAMVVLLLTNFRVELEPGHPPVKRHSPTLITVHPSPYVRLRLHNRE